MFICLRCSAPSSLAPCSCLCPELSGPLIAWLVCSSHFQGSSVVAEYALNPPPTTPRAFGVSSWQRRAVFGAREVAFLRQGVPLFPPRPQSSIDGWDCPIPAPRETWRHALGSRLPTAITSPLRTGARLWGCGSQEECYREAAVGGISAWFRFWSLVLSLHLELKCHHVEAVLRRLVMDQAGVGVARERACCNCGMADGALMVEVVWSDALPNARIPPVLPDRYSSRCSLGKHLKAPSISL